jgi:hypothetical protein
MGIALERAPVRRDPEALDRQTATAEVLQVISSHGERQPVFDKILESCQRLFSGHQLGISLVGDDGLVHLGAHRGSAREVLERYYPRLINKSAGAMGPDVFHFRMCSQRRTRRISCGRSPSKWAATRSSSLP